MVSIASAPCLTLRMVLAAVVGILVFSAAASGGYASDAVKIGVVHSQGGASAFVADAKGFFRAEGMDAELVLFDAAVPIAVAVASGDIDFGSTALTAAFCNLAYEGKLRIIASGGWERPGFQTIGFLVSNQAYAAGLRSFRDFGGHTVAITQRGTPLEYAVARILKKNAIPPDRVRIVPMPSNSVVASALKGGDADVGVQTVANVYPLVQKGDAKLLGWVADELGGGQNTATFTSAKIARERPDIVRRVVSALRKGAATWDAAFLDGQGNRADQASAPEMIDIVAKALKEPPDVVARGVGYFDPENRIVLSDLQDLLDWYQVSGMIKTHVDAASLLDRRFVIFAQMR
jgi:NitT/TauT family transport system substrate-binding protein